MKKFNPPMWKKGIALPHNPGKIKYILKQHGDDVISVSAKEPNFLRNKNGSRGRAPIDYSQNMTKVAYRRTLSRAQNKLLKLDLDRHNSKFITLTIADEEDNHVEVVRKGILDFEKRLNQYALSRNNSLVGTIRRIEVQEKSCRLHVHILAVFSSKPPKLLRKRLRDFWELGGICIESVYDLGGLFDYFTKYNFGDAIAGQQKMRFTKGMQIVKIGLNLEKGLEKDLDDTMFNDLLEVSDITGMQRKEHHYWDGDGALQKKLDKVSIFIKSRKT